MFLLLRSSLHAQAHVAEPAVNLGDTTFLDGIGAPGSLAEQIADGAYDGRVAGPNGATVPGAGAVASISGLTHVAWISQKRIGGAWYGAEVVNTEAYVNADTQGRQGGLGDLTVGPFFLQWSQRHLLGVPIDQRFVVDFDLPVGYYSRRPGVNLGSNTIRVHPYYAITVHPAHRIKTSWRVHYLWNSESTAPPLSTGAQSTQAGQAIHFNETAAYNVHKGIWIGANGYFLSQLTDGRINGVALPNSPERVGAIGPGMLWAARPRIFYYANEGDRGTQPGYGPEARSARREGFLDQQLSGREVAALFCMGAKVTTRNPAHSLLHHP
jgi:hypothetical protein